MVSRLRSSSVQPSSRPAGRSEAGLEPGRSTAADAAPERLCVVAHGEFGLFTVQQGHHAGPNAGQVLEVGQPDPLALPGQVETPQLDACVVRAGVRVPLGNGRFVRDGRDRCGTRSGP